MLGAKVGGAIVNASPTLDLDFTTGALDPRITFTRASTATYFDSTGVMQTAATNAPRFDYDPVTHVLRGLLMEDTRTNLLLNSATLGTQSVAVTAQAYALSFYGTGTVTLSGAFAGSLVGVGAFPVRASLVFTPAAGTLTCTVTGSVLNAQLEVGAFGTSWIPTAGATATRAIDSCTIPSGNMDFFVSPGGSWMTEFTSAMLPTGSTAARVIAAPGTGSITTAYFSSSAQFGQFDGSSGMTTVNSASFTATARGATTWAPGAAKACLNAGAVAINGALASGYGPFATSGVSFMIPSSNINENMTGYLRRVRYWPRVLTDAEMQSVTT